LASFFSTLVFLRGIDNLLVNMLAKRELSGYLMEKLTGKQRIIRTVQRKSLDRFALDFSNSITDYVPVNGYLSMIEAAREIRKK